MRGKTMVALLALVLFCSFSQPVLADSYFGYTDWGGSWHDVDKTWVDDSQMCWAASASNILAWSGWGTAAYHDEFAIFPHFKKYWNNVPGFPGWVWNWWFDGTGGNSDEMKQSGGGDFYPGYNYASFFSDARSSDAGNFMYKLNDYLHSGYGVSLAINGGTTGHHALTCWGFEFNPQYEPFSNSYYTYIYVTDSDDNKSLLKKYPIQINPNGVWTLQNTAYKDWTIDLINALKVNPNRPKVMWIDKNKSLTLLFLLTKYLSFDYRWDNSKGSNSQNYFFIDIEDPNTETHWRNLAIFFQGAEYADLQGQMQSGDREADSDWLSFNLEIPEEYQGLHKLRFGLMAFEDTDPVLDLYGLAPVPLPGAFWLLSSGLLGLGLLSFMKR